MTDKLSQENLHKLFKLDDSLFDIEITDKGNVTPVVPAYDDEKIHLYYWCIHCRRWHFHGRGGSDKLYTEGYAGSKNAHCVANNSPYNQTGIILHVIGKYNDSIRKKYRQGTYLHCPKCNNIYSAAFNACDQCNFINKNRKSAYPEISKFYQEKILNQNTDLF